MVSSLVNHHLVDDSSHKCQRRRSIPFLGKRDRGFHVRSVIHGCIELIDFWFVLPYDCMSSRGLFPRVGEGLCGRGELNHLQSDREQNVNMKRVNRNYLSEDPGVLRSKLIRFFDRGPTMIAASGMMAERKGYRLYHIKSLNSSTFCRSDGSNFRSSLGSTSTPTNMSEYSTKKGG
jgi:hypothetical protein